MFRFASGRPSISIMGFFLFYNMLQVESKAIDDVEYAAIAFSMGLTVELPESSTEVPRNSTVKLRFKLVSVRSIAAAGPTQRQYFNLGGRATY